MKNLLEKITYYYNKTLNPLRVQNEQKSNQLSDDVLQVEFKKRLRQIQEVNSRNLCEKYAREIVQETLKKDNYLISVLQAMPQAIDRFLEKKYNGEIDIFNREV
jgi:hypothetical protein